MSNEEKLKHDIEELALKYGLIVFIETGFEGTCYHLMRRSDAQGMLLAGWQPQARMH